MKNIDQNTFLELSQKDNYAILDVRRPDECATGIVENALMIDFLNTDQFINEINKLDKTKSYLVYCRSGNRSGQACNIMDSLGFEDTYNLTGGMLAWTADLV